MDLYREKRNQKLDFYLGMARSLCRLIYLPLLYILIFQTEHWPPEARRTVWLCILLPPMFLAIILDIVGLRLSKGDRITPDVIVSSARHGIWLRKRLTTIPILSIASASMVEHGAVEAPGGGNTRGVLLVLKDGSSRLIGFEYPAKAEAAIQKAMVLAGHAAAESNPPAVQS